jgi:mono/diheme cytochrome c family protein
VGFVARLILLLAVVAGLAAAAVAWLGAPGESDPVALPAHTADPENGKRLFIAGGCLSCHAPPESSGIDATLPAGGAPLKSPVGTFYPPNITPDRETGIGAWSDAEFIRAMREGISPGRRHYFPAFPYTSYRHMTIADLLDLKAYLFSLEPARNPAKRQDIPLARLARAFVGPWKWIAMNTRVVADDPARSEAWNRGAYLVQGPGHCGECHTPRNIFMAWRADAFLAGGPHPAGKGKVPSLRGLIARKRFKDVDDLVLAFQFGEVLGYEDMSSGGMGKVRGNIGTLPEDDVRAIATFLLSLE